MYFVLNQLQQTSPSWSGFEIYLRDPVRFKTFVDAQRHYLRGMLKLGGAGNKTDQYTTELMDFMTALAKVIFL